MSVVAAFALLAASQPASAVEPLDVSVAQLARRIGELDGRMVRVHGWVDCRRWGCTIRARPASLRDSDAGQAQIVRLGDDPATSAAIDGSAGRQIILEGRVTAACRREICTDQRPELIPTAIIRLFGAPRATVKDR